MGAEQRGVDVEVGGRDKGKPRASHGTARPRPPANAGLGLFSTFSPPCPPHSKAGCLGPERVLTMSAYEYTRLGALLAWVPRLFLVCLFIQERTACASSAMRLSRISGVTYPRGRLSVALLSGAEVPMHDRMDTYVSLSPSGSRVHDRVPSSYLAEVE
jgi:hypothetical protein